MSFDKFKPKYKIHEETENYFKLRAEAGAKPYDQLTVEEAREGNIANAKRFAGTTEFEGTVKEFTVPTKHCSDGIPITVYRSKHCDLCVAPSVFVYFHGGGNVVGSRQTVDTICRIFSRDAPCVVVNVEYRLAPEHRWPANHEDATCVVRWVKMNKSLLGAVNESSVGVGGDSAGGRMAAMVCHDLPEIDYQVLVYPSVDLRRNYKSAEEFAEMPGLTKKMVDWFMDHYIDSSDLGNARASPLLQTNFNTLPPALIIIAELDALRDEGIAYHEKLKAAGVKSQIFTVKGVTHGFFHLPGHFKECCLRAHEKVCKFIKANS
ncbi:ethyl acetate hydrolase-like isoform X4 [Crassostrea virginica]|uniref:AB hydrolase superfamily protein C1039.03-like isoform X4 n=1 Tax=Crassostrea virginica TaxID=6565 RepID=A0A8B8DXZ6_CRAVI|nr:AB hydrolase superfamily protein C1039.03-like isoform X4 [Crassostrea virginica]XP_022333295.1 AB hydrolase superfamily protein C1039.03-like isoform X4 [Crassostrea virginica]